MLNSKQRAYLKSEAAKIDTILQVGKAGVTPEVVKSTSEDLAARELIKGCVLDNCFDDVRNTAETIAGRARAEVVQTIGRRFVLYKPSDKQRYTLPK